MASLLVVDAPHAEEARGRWRRGDVVVVVPDGWQWGLEEDPATRTNSPPDRFRILEIPGAPPDTLMDLTAPHQDARFRRKHYLRLAGFPRGRSRVDLPDVLAAKGSR